LPEKESPEERWFFSIDGFDFERSPAVKYAAFLAASALASALFSTGPAFADTLTFEPAAESASETVQYEAEAKPIPASRRLARANRDARHCLNLPTNRRIIKCAERYL
jgi:hypothetical protein